MNVGLLVLSGPTAAPQYRDQLLTCFSRRGARAHMSGGENLSSFRLAVFSRYTYSDNSVEVVSGSDSGEAWAAQFYLQRNREMTREQIVHQQFAARRRRVGLMVKSGLVSHIGVVEFYH